jgi:hypothetical protein
MDEEIAQKQPEPELSETLIPGPNETALKKTVLKRRSVLRFEKRFAAIVSIVLKSAVLILVLLIAIFVFRELNDSSYSIQEINVPSSFQESGYNGQVVAERISDKLIDIISKERFSEEASMYSNSAGKNDVSVDVVGTGIPVRAFVDVIGQGLGISRRRKITGNITVDGDTAVLILRVDNHKPERHRIKMNGSLEHAMQAISEKSSESILKFTSPYLLARHYLFRSSEGCLKLGKYLLKEHKGDPKMEAVGYFAWTGFYVTERKFAMAEQKVREGLAKYPSDINLNAALGSILQWQSRFSESLIQDKKVISMFNASTSIARRTTSTHNLGLVYWYLDMPDSSIYYLEQAKGIDEKSSIVYSSLARVYLVSKHDTVRYFENIEKALEMGAEKKLLATDTIHIAVWNHPQMKSLLERFPEN